MKVDLETIATHEAAHGVMRWLRCMPATELTAGEEGGYCAGTGKPARIEDCLLVTLAGFAYESGYGIAQLNFANCRSDDFDCAREMLARAEWLRVKCLPEGAIVESVDDALARQFQRACDLLLLHAGIVDELGWLLEAERRLSARRVAAILREYGKR